MSYKVLFGVPSEKKYYVGCLSRNGNKIRQLDDDDGLETYKSELEQILPSLPEHARKRIPDIF